MLMKKGSCSSGVASCGDCGAICVIGSTLRFSPIACQRSLGDGRPGASLRGILLDCNAAYTYTIAMQCVQDIIPNIVHCFVPSSKARLASSGYIERPTFEVCHTKRHRYAIEPTSAQPSPSGFSNALASRARSQHINHALHTPRYLAGLDCNPHPTHQSIN